MRITSRLKRIEEKVSENGQTWVIFSISHYAEEAEGKAAEERIIKDYVKQGNPNPTHRIFIREIPFPGKNQKEGFLSSFKSNNSRT